MRKIGRVIPKTFDHVDEARKVIKSISKLNHIASVCIGGSIAKGTSSKYSDLDLYVAKEKGIEESKTTNLRYIIDEEISFIETSSLNNKIIYHILLRCGLRVDLHVFEIGSKISDGGVVEVYSKDDLKESKKEHLKCDGEKAISNAEPSTNMIKSLNVVFWSSIHRFSKKVFKENIISLKLLMHPLDMALIRLLVIKEKGKDVMSGDFRRSSHAMSKVVNQLSKSERKEVRKVMGGKFVSREDAEHLLRAMSRKFEKAMSVVKDRYDIEVNRKIKKTAKERMRKVHVDIQEGRT